MSNATLKRNAGITSLTALASSGTLICCVLPAVMVSLGLGATLAGWATQYPQLVWLSAHKLMVFGMAALALAVSGTLLWYQRSLPCPADPIAGRQCARLRKISAAMFSFALLACATGALFAFVLPWWLQ